MENTLPQPKEKHSAFVEAVTYVLEEWRVLTVVFERTFTQNMAATVPWVAPLIPANFAYTSAKDKLQLTGGVPFLIAFAVEGLGMSVVSTAFELWDWRDKNKDERLSAPIFVSIATVVFYLAIVIGVNVGLDLGWPHWIIKVGLSLLSIPAVVTLALRSQHGRRVADKLSEQYAIDQKEADTQAENLRKEAEAQAEKLRLEEIELDRQRRQTEFEFEQKRLDAETRRTVKLEKVRNSGNTSGSNGTSKTSKTSSGSFGNLGRPSIHKQKVFEYIENYFAENGNVPTFTQVSQALSLSQSTTSRLRGEWLKEKGSQAESPAQ